MGERLILALDGSTDVCSAALLRARSGAEGEGLWDVVARRAEPDGRAQARVLLGLVDDMLCEVGGAPPDVAAVVAGIGPGTFTGVRIAVATARALALALSVPVVGISTLAGLAAGAACGAAAAGPDVEYVVPLVDARRGQVFYAVYGRARSGAGRTSVWQRTEEHGVCDQGRLSESLEGVGPSRSGGVLVEGGAGAILVTGEARILPPRLETGMSRLQTCPAAVAAEWLVQGQERLQEPGVAPAGSRLGPYLMGTLGLGRPLMLPGRRLMFPRHRRGSGAWGGGFP